MGTDGHDARRIYELRPAGPEVPTDAPHRLAASGGELVGCVVDGAVWTWLTKVDGQLVLMMWPPAFRAHFDPLELLDDQGRVVARGGDLVAVVGGELSAADPRTVGHERAFAAWTVSTRLPPHARG
jgi:hypothetical protein